ncbi:alpha/beta fold hydrolase [Thalassolituus oleivorans]|uniref:alpha/beta hydrolase family protein n=1 Tax=Thalassolituus oleivorans TaxID=187493 RepID=UPI002409C515|nr:alpha/beta fold hydrolase [Thalassolituus oleivorans]MDF1640434.1 alpha/beta hydrolase [Thalassolituus oleivorans]
MSYRIEKLQTAAGHSIVSRVFPAQLNDQQLANGVCIIAPATGVAQYLYDDFAYWLTARGYNVVTFDYDGVGLSVDRHAQYSKSDILSWASNDCPAVLAFVEQEFPTQERTWIGHSVGGQVLGMMASTDKIDRAITVASGTGTWWYNSMPTKRFIWFLWYILVPVTVPIFGYFPGEKVKLMCNMPKGVMLQLRHWCLNKEYAIGSEGQWLRDRFANVKTPITAIAFSDDDMMSMKNVDLLHRYFVGAPMTRITVTPKDINQKRIGHIGWHRKCYQEMWDKVFTPVLGA